MLWLFGDFNNFAKGDNQSFVRKPKIADRLALAPYRQMHRVWLKVFQRLTEIQQQEPTHYCIETTGLARFGRIYSSLPAWMLIQSKNTAATADDLETLVDRGISDHALVRPQFSVATAPAPERRPIPK